MDLTAPRTAALLAALALTAPGALAQQYPVKPLRWVSPYPPGGGNDTLSRILAERIAETLGQRVIVDNRPGANSMIGTEIVAKSPPDGYTLLLIPPSFVTNPAFYGKVPYDPIRDFAPIGLVAHSPMMIVAHPSLPARTVKELIALARSKPKQLVYGTSGHGSEGHFGGSLFNRMAGVELVHAPYKGTNPAMIDLLGGHVPLMFASMLSVLPYAKAGRLRIIALTSAQRSGALPDVPTVAESGLPGYESSLWYGVLTSAGTPEPIITRLNGEFGKAMQHPDVREKIQRQGVEPRFSSAAEFAALIREEVPKWEKLVKQAGMRRVTGRTRREALAAALALLALAGTPVTAGSAIPPPVEARAVRADDLAGRQLVERLRRGGLVLFFRHADTRGMPCDATFRVGDRAGQRNLSDAGREQARRIGQTLRQLGIPLELPILAGPVYRARDTAELAFTPASVRVIDGLLADDYAGSGLDRVLDEHRRLYSAPVEGPGNRVLVGHRTPAILVLGAAVGGRAFPEGAALVLEPRGDASRLLGILEFAPLEGGGFHECGAAGAGGGAYR